jgi:hypothetical protein
MSTKREAGGNFFEVYVFFVAHRDLTVRVDFGIPPYTTIRSLTRIVVCVLLTLASDR